MKRHILSYLSAVLMLLCTSCSDDFSLATTNGEDTNGKITLNLRLSLPEMQALSSRALDDEDLNPHNPTVEFMENLRLYLFIFENTGSEEGNYLRTLVHGEQITVEKTEQDGDHVGHILQTIQAKVDGTSEDAIIHLVATADPNFEEQLQKSTDRSELGLFFGATGLYTQGNYPAFWKRINLGMPINAENKEQIEKTLSHVNMIRNFARVTVRLNPESQNLQGFTLMGYALVNSINCGYVAAYSENNPRGFVEFEQSQTTTDEPTPTKEMRTYDDLLNNANYIGNRHPLSTRDNMEEKPKAWIADAGGEDFVFTNVPKYTFERPYQEQHRTFVIVKGHFGDPENPRYIKLDIGTAPEWHLNDDGEMYGVFETYNLLRNFSYDITINNIASSQVGNASIEGAVAAPPANNVGTSIETRSLQDIADGVDRMWVNMTKLIIVDDDQGNPYPATADLRWRYVENYRASNKQNVSEYVKYDFPNMELAAGVKSNDIIDYMDGPNLVTIPNDEEFGNWRQVTLHFNKPDETVRQKTIRLYYSDPINKSVKLTRDIMLIMRKRWEFVNNIEIYPGAYSYAEGTMPYETLDEMRQNIPPGYVGSQRGAQLTVMFELPNDLPQSIFPLDFTIGADRQNIENAYVGNAVVQTGPSMFEDDPDGVGVMRMQFVKTVTWDEYHGSGDFGSNGHHIVCARFLTTNDVLAESGFNGTTSVTRVRVKNPYFKMGEDTFERAAHEDVIDPTRTRWHWNFTYPEWSAYFTTYYQTDSDPYNLNNLSFNHNYEYTNANGGLNMRIASGSATDPAFEFPVDISAEQFRGALTIQAWANSRNNGKTHGFHTDYDIYNRDIYAGVYYTDSESAEHFVSVGPKDCNATNDYKDQTIQNVVFNLSEFNIPNNAKVTKFIIWSTMDNYSYGEQWKIQEGSTNYRDILLLLN